jgi:hypothetical protein
MNVNPCAACCDPVHRAVIARADVASLAHLASALDSLKNKFPDPMWKACLRRAVREMHAVAMEIDGEHSFGIYAEES